MMDELKIFVDWLKDKADQKLDTVKHWTTDQLVEEFRREQKIREEHQADETDASRTSD